MLKDSATLAIGKRNAYEKEHQSPGRGQVERGNKRIGDFEREGNLGGK